ncbi:hypothetical protein BBP40_000036 [Aspergillus hancockii]|nr:hypothetical protein BBP40_000036 [Aspergillus hancockii]
MFFSNGIEGTSNLIASQTDINFYRHTAVELLATLVSLPESSKLGVKHGLNQWISDILNGRVQPSTVAPLLKILIRNNHGNTVDSFDIWKTVNTYFGNSDTKIIFPFLELPYELRLMIYSNYYELDATGSRKKTIIAYNSVPRGENRLAILRVSRQVYFESNRVLYNHFTVKLTRVHYFKAFLRPITPFTSSIIRNLHIDGISAEHVNVLAQLLSGRFMRAVRVLTLRGTPRYMGPATLIGRTARTRKRLVYPEYKKKLRLAVKRLFTNSCRLTGLTPVFTLEGFRKDPRWEGSFPEDWVVSAFWRE